MNNDLDKLIGFWLSLAGNITSIMGFILTILVWFGIKGIKAFYLIKATAPQQLALLEELRNKIEEQLNGKFDNGSRDNILEITTEVSAQIKNLSQKIKGLDKQQFRKLIEPSMNSFQESYDLFKANTNKNNARDLSRKLLYLLRSIQLLVDDDSWRRTQ